MGLGKMGDISDIGYHTLAATTVRCQCGTARPVTQGSTRHGRP